MDPMKKMRATAAMLELSMGMFIAGHWLMMSKEERDAAIARGEYELAPDGENGIPSPELMERALPSVIEGLQAFAEHMQEHGNVFDNDDEPWKRGADEPPSWL